MRVQFLGSGDAFGSGGRLQACILLTGGVEPVLLDCGATSLVAMKRAGVDPGTIGTVLISHLHGDHFGGLPFLVLDGQFSRRERPLLIAGPTGVRERVMQAMEVLFPGSSAVQRRFAVEFFEWAPGTAAEAGPCKVTPVPVEHASGAPAYGLRVGYGGRTIAYSGDTEWCEALVPLARGADLFICEGYVRDKSVKYHLNIQALREHLGAMGNPRVVLTHMSGDVLANPPADFACAEDGMVIDL